MKYTRGSSAWCKMRVKTFGCVLVYLGVPLVSATILAPQDLAPRAYVIAPIGGNATILQYSHLSGGLQFDGAIPGTTAKIGLPVRPAMPPAEFAKWQQKLLLGASVKIVAPTGQYNPTKLINWGNDRWAFKPEFGYSQGWGHWVLDSYTAAWFFTLIQNFSRGTVLSRRAIPVGAACGRI